MHTNITLCTPTLNEADKLIETWDTVVVDGTPLVEEVVIIDGNSDDETVAVAERWASRHGVGFSCIESSEREYLLEGPAVQRRRMHREATRDYVLALDADVRMEVRNPDWFGREFEYPCYTHTREKPSGRVEGDWRLFRHDPDQWRGLNKPSERVTWRGLIHEQLLARDGSHVSTVAHCPDAPFQQVQQRFGATDANVIAPLQQRRHDPRVGGNSIRQRQKQHYLLHRAMGCKKQETYVDEKYKQYWQENRALIRDDWEQIREAFLLPQHAFDFEDAENEQVVNGWDMSADEPFMSTDDHSLWSFLRLKAGEVLSRRLPDGV